MYVCHRCWLKWNLISWWQCVTTNTSSLLTCPWLLGAPSCRGYKVRVRCHVLPSIERITLPTTRVTTDSHDPNPSLTPIWSAPTTPSINLPDCLTYTHRSIIKQVASHPYLLQYYAELYLLNKFINTPQVKSKQLCAVEMLHGLFTLLPPIPLFLPAPSPSLFFVFCLWSDFITYATELFGPVGRWCPPHHTAHQRRTQTTCTSLLWPALTRHPVSSPFISS